MEMNMGSSISLSVIKELFDYAYWARDKQLEACAFLTQEQLMQPLGGSFLCLRDTLAHSVHVEWLWLERWNGRAPKTMPKAEELPTLIAVQERWQEIERGMRIFLAGLNEESLELVMTCTGTRGNMWTQPLWRFLVHFLNHQSYHRGQVTTLLRQLGIKPPTVDYLAGLDAGIGTV
jgi:uncharacterized damage-inducible protein DinB